ncbi:xylulokinase [Gordonia sp. TBRC 11910]|uniref:Xylulose kinase n=1 Tax=Gordonia asplenii TaxID=2725283 RepID=A0A848KP25_9ACTN|nr:xylulokinase [Gordonia asplenii]NMN99656.1 xylulokinase [Gordonia asplenii]
MSGSTHTRLVAGVDSSTQSCTVVLRDAVSGATVASGSSAHPPTTPPVSEQDPSDWWTALTRAMSAALTSGEIDGSAVVAMSVAAQAHGLVVVDEAGQVIRPAKLWNDTTSAEQASRLVDRLGRDQWVQRCGSVPPAAFTIAKLAWLAEHEPDALARTAQVMVPADWLTWRLTGAAVTDAGDASGTGYFDPVRRRWDFGLLDLVDETRNWTSMLPKVLAHDEPAGTLTPSTAQTLGLSPATVVGPGTADNQAAALGMGVLPGDVVVSLGTSGVVYACTTVPVVDLAGRINGNADAAGGYLPVFCTLNAAKVTDMFARLLNVSHQELSDLALAAPADDPERPVLAAFLDGERVPDRPSAVGTLSGLRSGTTREQVARAAYEGVVAGLVGGIDAFTGLGIRVDGRLAVTGGGAASPAYRQLLADLAGRPVYVVDEPQTAAAGAAVQAAAIVDGVEVHDLARRWAPSWRVAATPRSGANRDELLDRFSRVVSWSGLEN